MKAILVDGNKNLIWSERANIVIVAKKHDLSARILTSHLSKENAEVQLLTDEEQTLDRLSHTLLQAHCLR